MKTKLYSVYCKGMLKLMNFMRALGLFKIYQPIPQLGVTIDDRHHSRVVKRWGLIRDNLPPGKLISVDIGCNVGFYTIAMAELGHFSIGIEAQTSSHLFSFYAKEALGIPNVAFAKTYLNVDNIETMPAADCVLFLAVFHHWCRHYGATTALDMLDKVYEKTNKVLFFETGESGRNYEDSLPEMDDSPERWMRELFQSKGCSEIKTLSSPDDARIFLAVYK